MGKYAEAIKEAQFQIANAQVFIESKEYENEPAIQWSAKRKLRDFTIYLEALQIADRLEQADVINNEEIQIKACERYGCLEKECPLRARDKFCYDLAGIFLDGYNQALADIRGDNND